MTKQTKYSDFEIFDILIDLIWEHDNWCELAKDADVSYTTICNWAHQKVYAPRLNTLTKVAGALGWMFEIHEDRKIRSHLRLIK